MSTFSAFHCVVYVNELERAWLKRFLHLLSTNDDDDLVDDPCWETPDGAAARDLCNRRRPAYLDLHVYYEEIPLYRGGGIRCDFHDPGVEETGALAEVLRLFLQRWRPSEEIRIVITWADEATGSSAPNAGLYLVSRDGIVEVDMDSDLVALAHEQLDRETAAKEKVG